MLADKKVVASAVNIRGNQEKMKARPAANPKQNPEPVLPMQICNSRHASPCELSSVQVPAMMTVVGLHLLFATS